MKEETKEGVVHITFPTSDGFPKKGIVLQHLLTSMDSNNSACSFVTTSQSLAGPLRCETTG